MATLQDIANEAKVSSSAVSMVINGRPGIGADARQRVEAAIRKLGYRPRGAGRPIKRARTRSLAVIYSQTAVRNGSLAPLASAWIRAMRSEAGELGHHIAVFADSGPAKDDPIFQHALEGRELDGAILVGMDSEHGYLEAIQQVGLPVVVMNRRAPHDEFSSVSLDNYGGAGQAAAHLLELGHRRIAVIGGDARRPILVAKVEGFQAALSKAGIKPVCVEDADIWNFEPHVNRVCPRVMDSGATAVFILGDDIAVRCIDFWTERGVRVPRDLSVIGFDDLEVTSSTGLRPTSVGYNKEHMGREAVQLLLTLADDQSLTRSLTVVARTRVVEHDTTSPRALA